MDESDRFAHMFCKSIGLVRKWPDIRIGGDGGLRLL